ncbi:BspA family leucine-rich repeat surface protein [Mycoplasma capricolum]|uniref:BspA family leucine-rich repeat surface protein n=1 Tax=Mycoplasma capricolum TaxID=2095 RepID=UPI003DA68786
MKKILTILTSFSLIATSSFLVVACKPNQPEKKIEIPKGMSDSNREKEKNNKDKKPESKIDQPQNDQLRNGEKKEKENSNATISKDNILSSIEDERIFIKKYSEWWDKRKTNDVPHFHNPYDPTEILTLGYEKASNINDGIKLKHIPKTVKKVPKTLPKKITSLEGAFKDNENSTIDGIEYWDTSLIRNMYQTFYGAVKFNGDITKWRTDNVKNFDYMLAETKSFNQPLNSWNVSKSGFQFGFAKNSTFENQKDLWPPFPNKQ